MKNQHDDKVKLPPYAQEAPDLDRLKALVDKDELTNLYNRRYFKRRLDQERARADKEGHSLTILMIDVDNFKTINDSVGHSAGDAVLRTIAQLLMQSVREADICCRYAGDEFVAILPRAEEDEAKMVAERIRESIFSHGWRETSGIPVESVSVSIGYSIYPKHEVNLSMLFDRADMALYNAKRAGRNRISDVAYKPDALNNPSLLAAPFLHREKEIALLDKALKKAEDGNGSILLIMGEAGVGKTKLLSTFRQQTMLCRATVLTGSSYSETQGIPYYPFREILNQVSLCQAFKERYATLKPVYRREIQKLAPQLSADTREDALEATYEPDRYLLYEGILNFLSAIASHRPVMLVIEDIHWADAASLSLLRYLGRNASSKKVVICATVRTEELEGRESQKTELRSLAAEKFCQAVELTPFTEEQTQRLLKCVLRDVSSVFASHVHSMAQGNPMFVMESVRSIPGDKLGLVLEARSLEQLKKTMEVPKSLHKLVARRIDGLDEEARKVLSYAAVLGNEFDFGILSRLLEMNEGNLLDVLDRAAESHFVRERTEGAVDRYAFQHVLVADFLYETLSPRRRAFLHERVGNLIESEMPGKPEEKAGVLAHHFEKARLPDREYKYCKIAGKKAFETYANREARTYLERAAKILGDTHPQDEANESMSINLMLAALDERVGDYESATKRYTSVLDASRRQKDAKSESDALISLGVMHERLGSFEEALDSYRDALAIKEALGDKQGIARVMHNIANIHLYRGNYPESMDWYRKAMARFEEAGDEYGKAFNYCNMGIAHQNQGDYDKALDCYQKSLELRTKTNDQRGKIYSLNNIGGIYYLKGDYRTSLKYREEAFKIAQEIEHKKGMALNLQNMASLEKEMGSFDRARELAERSMQIIEEMGYKPLLPRTKAILAEVVNELGDTESGCKYCAEAEQESKEMGSKQLEADAHRVMGIIQTCAKQFKKAEDELETALKCYVDIGMKEGQEEIYYAMGKMEQARKHRVKAKEHLLKARNLYEQSGNRFWAERISREMRDGGLT
jgi:diguanylate cyclase (GGDEF)-like protein